MSTFKSSKHFNGWAYYSTQATTFFLDHSLRLSWTCYYLVQSYCKGLPLTFFHSVTKFFSCHTIGKTTNSMLFRSNDCFFSRLKPFHCIQHEFGWSWQSAEICADFWLEISKSNCCDSLRNAFSFCIEQMRHPSCRNLHGRCLNLLQFCLQFHFHFLPRQTIAKTVKNSIHNLLRDSHLRIYCSWLITRVLAPKNSQTQEAMDVMVPESTWSFVHLKKKKNLMASKFCTYLSLLSALKAMYLTWMNYQKECTCHIDLTFRSQFMLELPT